MFSKKPPIQTSATAQGDQKASKKAQTKPDGRRENAVVTRAALQKAGLALFGRVGFEASSVAQLCAAAGVTAGALYHHYGDKKGLFAAVAEELDASLVARSNKAAASFLKRRLAEKAALQTAAISEQELAWQAFLAGVDEFLNHASKAEFRRIGLADAPAVLGLGEWNAIRERHGIGNLTRALAHLQAQGVVVAGDASAYARLALGVMHGAVESVAAGSKSSPKSSPKSNPKANIAANIAANTTANPKANLEANPKARAQLRQRVHAMLSGLRFSASFG